MRIKFSTTAAGTVVTIVAAAVLAPGCVMERGTLDEAWSTKNQSVLAKDDTMPALNVTTPFSMEATGEVRAAAVNLLRQAADSTNPLLRANAIEALSIAPGVAESMVRLGLVDDNRGVRFVAAMTVGDQQIATLVDDVRPLLQDESDSVRAAAIYAVRRVGERADLSPLAEFLMRDDAEVRANAAMVLGRLGDPSALGMLRDVLQRRLTKVGTARARIVELQIAEAMVRLGADEQLEVIRAALFTPVEQGELTVLATQALGDLRDRAYASALLDKAIREGRDREPAEVRIAAAQAVARIDPDRSPTQVPLGYLIHDHYALRAQAANALGWMGDPVTLPRLAALLDDPNALVQVAAAGAIVRLTG
ncbi:MAG: HEAT repeat domain-containing protein [Phycisphaerales bacterium]|nr:HEAT repeat domain-containing protein [Phycisphaerales bacterium]NNM26574.1 HEAT repeat domain-containing protein [Phycisphaerales bacterium]